MATTTAYRTCPLCEATCGLALTVEDGRVTAIRGDADHVFSRGFICPKGAALAELHEDPDRLRTPLVRQDGVLVPATWDEALAAVERGLAPILATHGRDAIALYLGNPNVHTLAGQLYIRALLQTLRTKSLFTASTLDQMPKHVACGLMFGDADAIPVPDLDHTDLLVILGANPLDSNGSLCTAPDFPGRLKDLRARGGRLVVVDPRRTRTADVADLHLPIRPGGDPWLLLALAEHLVTRDLVDLGALAPHVAGLDALRDAVRRFPAERVADRTGLPAAAIRALADELAAAPTAAVYGRLGTHTARFGTVNAWLVDVLNALTGNLDQPGGACFPLPFHAPARPGRAPGGHGFLMGRYTSRVGGHPEVRRELPTAALPDEILTPGDGQVRALITIAGNPALSAPGGDRLDAALEALDFMVAVDPYVNETTRHADVILPPPSALERAHCDLAFAGLSVRNVVSFSPPTLPLPADAMDECDILLALTTICAGRPAGSPTARTEDFMVAMLVTAEVRDAASPLHGRDAKELITALASRRGPERLLDWLLRAGTYGDHFGARPGGLTFDELAAAPHGIDLGPLQPRLPGLLETPSGKVELAPEALLADLDRLEAEAAAERADPGALVLIGRRHLRSNNSWMHNVERLATGKARCALQVHPEDAARLGLADGAAAHVTSAAGEVTVEVQVTDVVRPGVVSLPHGWGHGQPGARLATAARFAGVNVNRLVDPAVLDPLSGNAVQNGVPVAVRPA